jgi:hypothetical protein
VVFGGVLLSQLLHLVVLRSESVEQTAVWVLTIPHDITLAGVTITTLVAVDEIVVREAQSCCLEVVLFSVRVHALVSQAHVRAVT